MGEGCKILDLRSDTSSPPTEEMLEAIKKAEVGNNVFDEDPNINKLENSGAELFKMEKALFVPSGIQGNLLALLCHTSPGEYLVAERTAHIIRNEGRSYEFVARLKPYLIEDVDGIYTYSIS